MDAAIWFILSWLALVGVLYIFKKDAVKYFVAIYWKSEKLTKYVVLFTDKLRFIPLKVYLVSVLVLFALPMFLAMPFIRPDGQLSSLPGFLYILVGGTVNALRMLLGGAPVQEAAAGSAGVTPIVPGLTLPWDQLPYLAVAIAVAVVLHELMHGYAALRYGIPVKSVGVFSLFYILSGAFVEPDEDQFKKASTEAKAAVLASGVAANVVIAIIAMLIGVFGAWAGLGGAVFGASAYGIHPGDRVVEIRGCGFVERVYTPDDFVTKINVLAGLGPLLEINKTISCKPGDKVTLVAYSWLHRYEVQVDYSNFTTPSQLRWLYTDGSLYLGGVRPGDVIKRVEGCGVARDITSSGDFLAFILESRRICKAGDAVKVYVERNGTIHVFNVTLVEKDGRLFYGIGPTSFPLLGYDYGPVKREQLYNTDFTKLIFWLLVVNYGLAAINALPIYPLDGGQLLAAVAQRKLGEKKGTAVVNAVTWILAAMLISNIALGLIGEQYRVLEAIR
ncbi:M50 family metallopeptidase [Pyrobaculum sp.]|uniref:M50 family metallopeptidase n=1 Tax=Pyrobaculum sp. TaxID=2004705 RepID=UPI00316B2DBF